MGLLTGSPPQGGAAAGGTVGQKRGGGAEAGTSRQARQGPGRARPETPGPRGGGGGPPRGHGAEGTSPKPNNKSCFVQKLVFEQNTFFVRIWAKNGP